MHFPEQSLDKGSGGCKKDMLVLSNATLLGCGGCKKDMLVLSNVTLLGRSCAPQSYGCYAAMHAPMTGAATHHSAHASSRCA